MSKYLESVCLWEQNEKYLFSFEGFYVKFACKKSQSPWRRVLEMRSVYRHGVWGWATGWGLASAVKGPALVQSWREQMK